MVRRMPMDKKENPMMSLDSVLKPNFPLPSVILR